MRISHCHDYKHSGGASFARALGLNSTSVDLCIHLSYQVRGGGREIPGISADTQHDGRKTTTVSTGLCW